MREPFLPVSMPWKEQIPTITSKTKVFPIISVVLLNKERESLNASLTMNEAGVLLTYFLDSFYRWEKCSISKGGLKTILTKISSIWKLFVSSFHENIVSRTEEGHFIIKALYNWAFRALGFLFFLFRKVKLQKPFNPVIWLFISHQYWKQIVGINDCS